MGEEAEALDGLSQEYEAYSDCYRREQQQRFDELRDTISSYRKRYQINKETKVGDPIQCPVCSKLKIKRHYQSAFCGSRKDTRCKDKYWNTVNDDRRERAEYYGRMRR